MKVFLMWSGERSRAVAAELRTFLRAVVQRPDYFMSTEDIESGAVWERVIAGELETTNVGIACLTSENLGSTWIHFEAGALSKASESSIVVPYLIGIDAADVAGPLTKFQFTGATNPGTFQLAETVNNAQPESDRTAAEALRTVFDALWPGLDKVITRSTDSRPESRERLRPPDDILREILDRIRVLERRTDRGSAGLRKPDVGKVISRTSDAELNGARLLWVDDHPENNKRAEMALRNAGVAVTLANSTEEGMSLIDVRGMKGFDIVVTDMGRGDNPTAGLEFAQKARTAGFTGPIILFSTSGDAVEHKSQLDALNVVGPVVGYGNLVYAMNSLLE